MYKNLNDYTATTLDVRFNNTLQLTDVGRQVNAAVKFTKYDIQLLSDNKKLLIVQDRIIKHCIIRCPDGQIWNALDYKHHHKQYDGDKDRTTFDFSYIDDNEWLDGDYYIYVGASDVKNTFSNSPKQHGIGLLRSESEHFFVKKLIAGNGIKLLCDKDSVLISSSQHNYTNQPLLLTENSIIDIKNGNIQLCYSLNDACIIDVIDTSYQNQITTIDNSSNSSDSSSTYTTGNELQEQVYNVTILFYKPLQSTLKYKELQLLQRYDIGWFAFTIRKMFGALFISQPTRIITDFMI